MDSKISVFVLAAGMGSRYGGLKQMEGFGPNGETIIDYSIYDAIKAGFDKIVFVIRPDMEEAFKEVFLRKYEGKIDIQYCFQTVDMLPDWYEMNPERTKPWGTTHAMLMAKDNLHEPFIVINGDDFYGQEAFALAAKFLREECSENLYAVTGYKLKNVLSPLGGVKRGICIVDEDNNLISLKETFEVARVEDGTINGVSFDDGTPWENIDEDIPVSMNMFCYHQNILNLFQAEFDEFLKTNDDDMTGEYIMAVGINKLIEEGKIKMKIIPTDSPWFGVTYKEDAPGVRAKLQELVDNGTYPSKLEG